LTQVPGITHETKKKKFVKAFLENGGNATQAALAMQPLTYDSARQAGSAMLKRPDVVEAIRSALEDLKIDYHYVLSARRSFVDRGLAQLHGYKTDTEPFVSPSDTHKHLQGIETILERIEGRKETSSNLHLHLDLSNLSHKELLQKHTEASRWFSSIIEGEEVIEHPVDPDIPEVKQ